MDSTDKMVSELIGRSNRLGSDPRNTNYAGGNASAKGTAPDPVTGAEVNLVWVKGSGGDLGTLTPAGLAVLRLDRLRARAVSSTACAPPRIRPAASPASPLIRGPSTTPCSIRKVCSWATRCTTGTSAPTVPRRQ